MSFKQIQNKYTISRSHFLGFLQVRHFVKSYFTFPNNQPFLSPTENFLLNFNLTAFNDKKFSSLFYEKLISFNSANADRTRELWGKDLEVELIAEAWSDAFISAKKVFTCNRFRESQYRILHRLQRTPHFLHKINPQISPTSVESVRKKLEHTTTVSGSVH